MPDIIRLLPDSVANQIAAGEVIQRPASVVKELLENAIDAGGKNISLVVKDAGRTLIQVTDDGSGMSETDARMAFERHATSKIREASDLFSIRTMGFRGEALASIAAVAEVVLRTRTRDSETGTEVRISGSKFLGQEPVACNPGTQFQIKNLFFNTPARRKFLKSDTTEQKYILQEFFRVAIPFPDISFVVMHNNAELYNLPSSGLLQRIIRLMGKQALQNLVEIKSETSLVSIGGYIGKPQLAKKTYGDQYFFVNRRFIRHGYLHKAVAQAYEKILPSGTVPSYFIFLTVPPESIDVNIHPTKTEVKFEDEQAIWQILHASVREGLGKFNIIPSLDFETDAGIEIPVLQRTTEIRTPEIQIDPEYNPFEKESERKRTAKYASSLHASELLNWEKVYAGFERVPEEKEDEPGLFQQESQAEHILGNFIQVKGKYIITSVRSGLMVIDQKKAHERILYERYLERLKSQQAASQQELFPRQVALTTDEYHSLLPLLQDLQKVGVDLRDFGNGSVVLYGCPPEWKGSDPEEMIRLFVHTVREEEGDPGQMGREKIAESLAKATAIPYGKLLSQEEMNLMTDQLFACSNPSFSFDGRVILTIITLDEIEKKFR